MSSGPIDHPGFLQRGPLRQNWLVGVVPWDMRFCATRDHGLPKNLHALHVLHGYQIHGCPKAESATRDHERRCARLSACADFERAGRRATSSELEARRRALSALRARRARRTRTRLFEPTRKRLLRRLHEKAVVSVRGSSLSPVAAGLAVTSLSCSPRNGRFRGRAKRKSPRTPASVARGANRPVPI